MAREEQIASLTRIVLSSRVSEHVHVSLIGHFRIVGVVHPGIGRASVLVTLVGGRVNGLLDLADLLVLIWSVSLARIR